MNKLTKVGVVGLGVTVPLIGVAWPPFMAFTRDSNQILAIVSGVVLVILSIAALIFLVLTFVGLIYGQQTESSKRKERED